MKFDCKINVKHNFKKINTIIKELPKKGAEGTEDMLENMKGYAIKLENGHNEERDNCRNDRYVNQGS